ncbi:hypothetical protein, partial [Vibrio toranzoniae]|uniref:hypothetical protein n=1 Tax=Vibrio toranzoniae TaxID=1194427 RepID=UPI003075DAE4
GKLTKRLRQIRNAWHFHYALISVFKVLCGGFVLRCSLLSLALVASEKNAAKAENLWLMNCAILLCFVFECGLLKLCSMFNVVVLFCRFRRKFTF